MQPATLCCFQKSGAKVLLFEEIHKFFGIELLFLSAFLMFRIDTTFLCLKWSLLGGGKSDESGH